jgi:hypothetical protein
LSSAVAWPVETLLARMEGCELDADVRIRQCFPEYDGFLYLDLQFTGGRGQ